MRFPFWARRAAGIGLAILAIFMASARAEGSSKRQYVERLKVLAEDNHKLLAATQENIKTALQSQDFVNDENSTSYAVQIKNVEKLLAANREYKLRQDFWNRLLSQVDTKYERGPLRDFMIATLRHMTLTEALNTDGEVPMWKFLNFLGYNFQTVIEKNEDPIRFIESYLLVSPISSPMPPSEFSSHRAYTNGNQSRNAKTVSRDQLGEEVEQALGPFAN